MAKVIRSKRASLMLKAILGLATAAVAGWFLQSWDVVHSSALGRLSASTHLPAIELIVWGVGIALVGTVLLDHWSFSIELRADDMVISERLGVTTIRYDNIESVKKLRLGAGITLKDPKKWLETFQGSDTGFGKLCKTSGLLKGVYGCDLCIRSVRLDIGVEPFLALLNERAAAPFGVPAAV